MLNLRLQNTRMVPRSCRINSIWTSSSQSLIDKHKEFINHVKLQGNGKVILTKGESYFEILISNPEKRNAISGKMMYDLIQGVDNMKEMIHQDKSIVAIKVKGMKGSFCSGVDFDLISELLNSPDLGRKMSIAMSDALSFLHNGPLLSVACVDGPAVGGGAEIATSCDFCVMSERSSIRFIHSYMGISPGWGCTEQLISKVGRKAAISLLCSSKSISASEAIQLGLIDVISLEGECSKGIDDHCDKLLEPYICSRYPAAVRACKQIIGDHGNRKYMDVQVRESDVFGSLWMGRDHRDALRRITK